MPDLQARLIEAAVRPLASDAEVMQSGKGFVATLTTIPAGGAEAALKRWDAVDAKAGKTVWRLLFYLLVTVVLVLSLTSDVSEFTRYHRILRSGSYEYGGYAAQDHFNRTYSAAEKRLLLIGEVNKPISERAKALWDSDPNNAAYFANYAVSYLSETNKLPAGFMETARRLDPENSFFLYLGATNEVRRIDKSPSPWRGENVHWGPYDHVLAILNDASKLHRFDNYLVQLRRERIPLLPQSTIFEYMDSANFLARSYSPRIDFAHLKNAMPFSSSWIPSSGSNAGFSRLNRDTDALFRAMTHSQWDPNEYSTFTRYGLNEVLEYLSVGARRLGLNAEAAELGSKIDQLKQWEIDRRASLYEIDGRPWRAKIGILKSGVIQINQAVHPPALTDNDVKPGRMFDHGMIAQISSYAVAAILGLMSIVVALFRFRSPPLVRRLSARMEVLLQPVDWLWLLAAGLPPLPYLMLVAHLTNLGGYGSRFTETPIDLPYNWQANLPMAQFAGMLLMMLILPILLARWRLGIRAAAFGFANTRLWLGSLAMLSATAFIPVVGRAVMDESKAGLVAAWALLEFPVAWLCGVACRAMISGTAWLLHHTTASRVLVPVYIAGLLFLLLAMPFFKWSRQYWFERDSLSRLDPAYPAFSKFEYELSLSTRKELCEALGYAP